MVAKRFIALALATLGASHIVESIPSIPHPWVHVHVGPVPGIPPFELTIVLRTNDSDNYASTITAGGRLSQEEVAAYRQPSKKSIKLVTDWLDDNYIDSSYEGNDLIRFNITKDHAEKVLDTKLDTYRFMTHQETFVRALEYSVPDDLKDHIDFIHPLCNWMAPKRDPLLEHSNWDMEKKANFHKDKEPIPARMEKYNKKERNKWFEKMRLEDEKTYADSVNSEETEDSHDGEDLGELHEISPAENEEDAEEHDEEETQFNPKGEKSGKKCSWHVLPECLREQYEFPTFKHGLGVESGIRVGLAGTIGTSINWEDLGLFSVMHVQDLPGNDQTAKVKMEIFKGDQNAIPPRVGGHETMIDLQYGYALAHPHSLVYYTSSVSSEDSNSNEAFLDLLDYLLQQPTDNLPHVLAVPYHESEVIVRRQYAELLCKYFGLLTARGVTIIVSSGDGGAAGAVGSEADCAHLGLRPFRASFPATCPWVTSVGGVNTKKKLSPLAQSGGGFSELFPRPSWQNKLVGEYESILATKKLPKGDKQNRTLASLAEGNMRAIPDISVVGNRLQPIYKGRPTSWPEAWGGREDDYETHTGIDTTAGSAVLFASMVAHAAGQHTGHERFGLGWLNQWLYENVPAEAFQDVKKGHSNTCSKLPTPKYRVPSRLTQPGWPAAAGWDAATGRGAPWGMRLFQYL